jgi:hypothetical protein
VASSTWRILETGETKPHNSPLILCVAFLFH